MSNLSAKILRAIVAEEFGVIPEAVRISGYADALDANKEWYGFYHSVGFKKIEPYMANPIFLVSKMDGVITVHG